MNRNNNSDEIITVTLSKRFKSISALIVILTFIIGFAIPAFAAWEITDDMEQAAQQLNTIGLFKGTGSGFDLEKAPDRTTAFVMLIRLTGKENECLAGNWNHPFTDVPEWAAKYIGYAYVKGLASGVGDGKFGAGDKCTVQMYATMALRALGYSDKGSSPDFSYMTSTENAVKLGLLTEIQLEACRNDFLRGDLAMISANMMVQPVKDTNTRLIDSLVAAGAVNKADADTAGFSVSGIMNGSGGSEQGPTKNNAWVSGWFGGLGSPDGKVYEVTLEQSGIAQAIGEFTWEQYKSYCSYVQAAGFEPRNEVSYRETDFIGYRGAEELIHIRYDGHPEPIDPESTTVYIITYVGPE